MDYFEQTVKNLNDNYSKDSALLQNNKQLFLLTEKAAKDHPELDLSLSNTNNYAPGVSIWLKQGQSVKDALRFVTSLCRYRSEAGIHTRFQKQEEGRLNYLCITFEDDQTMIIIWITSQSSCAYKEVGKKEVPIYKLVCGDEVESSNEIDGTTNDKTDI